MSLPFGLGKAEWQTDPAERQAAWALYVELVTRIAVQGLDKQQGSLREALDSLYSLFPSTREILKQAVPDVGATSDSVGGLAIRVLNRGLRPFLSKWHPRLLSWEEERSPKATSIEHEQRYAEASRLREELQALHTDLEIYATALGVIAGVME